ncbi:pyridoxamine 5'-phosphate oxidase family protein [Halorientalis litorea]|jgi:nitroimidazol reductase NimA-like FMN-containing flavoprotein (pyridoxamine 5'-phosphate oxidase superfamily)|uniref:pyridoxamine 5'-phosphate oxidase family protein n=1 Tax=Halorientalis litorea TaxID=2931977 RepID=UPI001FF434CD|nr:pyridoxamine 5'-phosphate oxidase family protein [Halorientalis litorea]
MSIEELESTGIERMDGDEIDGFLSGQRVGVLGLPSENGPYMIPLSFGYDGESSLYFVYLLGANSRKEELTERAETATFLVYDATASFMWESALLSGTVEEVPESEWDESNEALKTAWRPDVFESAALSRGVKVYRFEIEDRTGLKHTGLPPALEPEE